MAVVKKISELTPKGSNLGTTDLLIVGVDNGTDYDLKSITGTQLLGTVVSQTITNGVTTKSPSEDVVYDNLALKVDKVVGSRLITSAEGTILSNTSGTNTGDQTLQQVTSLGSTTTQQLISNEGFFTKTSINQTLSSATSNVGKTEGEMNVYDLSGNSTKYKLNEITKGANSILLPSSAGTLALTSDLTSKVTSNTAITGATKTKITYDSKGLVTSGADATTADIADSSNKRYVTDAEKTKIDYLNTVASNVQDQLNAKVNLNTLITAGTGTKVTYDTKGLILSSTNITTSDVSGLGSLATQSGTFSGTSSGTNTGDQTYFDARVQSVTSSATVTPVSTNDLVKITAQSVGLTLSNPTGTFTEGQALMIRIKDNATAQTIAFGTNYRAIGVTLPTTTVISKTMYLGIIYNSTDTKWDVVGYNIQA